MSANKLDGIFNRDKRCDIWLRLETLDVSHDSWAARKGVCQRARIEWYLSYCCTWYAGEVKAGRSDGGIAGRVRWRNRRAWHAAGLRQERGEGGSKGVPGGLEGIPNRFAIGAVSEPCGQHAITRVMPDEQAPSRIVRIPPMAGIVEAHKGRSFCDPGVGDSERKIRDCDVTWTRADRRIDHGKRVVSSGQPAQVNFNPWIGGARTPTSWTNKRAYFASRDRDIVLRHIHTVGVRFVTTTDTTHT